MDERRLRSLSSNLETKRQRLKDLSRGLPLPTELVAMQAQRLDSISDRLPRALSIVSNNKRSLLLQTSAGLRPQVLKLKLVERTELINRFVKNIKSNMKIKIQHHQSALEGLERIRQTLGYEATLRRGYTVVRDQDGKLVTSVKKAEIKKVLEIEFQDGKTSLYK